MTKFTDMLVESTIIQGLMTLLLWGATVYLAINEKPIPEVLLVGDGAIVTFWFKTKTVASVR